MKVTVENIEIYGAALGNENPLPRFSFSESDKKVFHDGTFQPEDEYLFGKETAYKVLPYKMQDSYSRKREKLIFKSIVLENQNLKAVFLPSMGGRLISLFNKEHNREILYRNPVFQPANLAIRDAWFSGGIEWNTGLLGHTVTTCDNVFFAELKDSKGNSFLRMWDYHRIRKIFWSIDFHLPSGEHHLGAYIKIINDKKEKTPVYWWTNTALKEEEGTRVFSETADIIYIKPEQNSYGRTIMPYINNKDISYPLNFDYSNEYFFQTPEVTKAPWEAVAYKDGTLFYERSTNRLRYRKMFCWGNQKGGRHWCDYLSDPGKGNYLEIQAGLAPTQLHGMYMPPESEWDFSQFFGETKIPAGTAYGEWYKSGRKVLTVIDKKLSEEKVYSLHEYFINQNKLKPQSILHNGNGWGAIEKKRRKKISKEFTIPENLIFPDNSINNSELPWVELLETGEFPTVFNSTDYSWMTDLSWEPVLKKAIKKNPDNHWLHIQLGVMNAENGKTEIALKNFQDSISIKSTAVAWRNIAWILYEWGETDQAAAAIKRAAENEISTPDGYISRELLEMLVNKKRFKEAWDYFKSLPKHIASNEKICIPAAEAAFYTENYKFLDEFFTREFVYIREGELKIINLWYKYETLKYAEKNNIEITEELEEKIRKNSIPPQNIDFRMYQ